MPRTCTICKHPQRLEIERAIVAGTSLRDIAGHFGTAKTNIERHRTHVTEAIARNKDARELVRTATLLEDVRAGERRVERLYDKAQQILTKALEDDDPRMAIQAIRAASAVMGEARGYMELRGELTNELGRDRTPAMSIQIICPQAPNPGAMPRVSYVSRDVTDAEDVCVEIGLVQH